MCKDAVKKALLAGMPIIGGGFFDAIRKPACRFSGGLTSQHPRKATQITVPFCARMFSLDSGPVDKDRWLPTQALGFRRTSTGGFVEWVYELARRAFR